MIQYWLGNQLKQPNGLLSKWVGIYMQRGNEAINRWTIDLLDIQAHDQLLEIGIGNGSTLHRIASNNKVRKIVGVDLSADMIKEAKKLNKHYIENGIVELQKGNVLSLPYKDAAFNKVFTIHTLYFWTDINKGFSEIHRVLEPGGILFLSITDPLQMQKMKRTKNFHLIIPKQIEELLTKHRFKAITIHQRGIYWCIEATKAAD